MTRFNSSDFLDAARPRERFLRQQRGKLQTQANNFDADIVRLSALHERTRQEMASYLLAEVGDDDLDALQKKLSYPGLLTIKAQFEARLEAIETERLKLDAMHEIEHNAFHVAQAEEELDALREACRDYRTRIAGWENSRWFIELSERGFFSRNYEPDFFDRFWDWRAVSWLMDDLEDNLDLDFATPDKVRDAWLALYEEATPVLEAWDGLIVRLRTLTDLKARHDALIKAPEDLFQEMVAALTEAVLDHLDSCPTSLKTAMAKEDPFLITFFKKDAGLEKQTQYLKELKVTRIQRQMQSLDAELNKLSRKMAKAQRKYKYYDEATIRGMRNLKAEKWQKRHAKLDKIRGRVAGFKQYDQGDFRDSYLWWDAMTRGAPADDIYEVSNFRRRNPNWDWRTHQDPWHAYQTQEPARTAMDTAASDLAERMQPNDHDDWSMDAS